MSNHAQRTTEGTKPPRRRKARWFAAATESLSIEGRWAVMRDADGRELDRWPLWRSDKAQRQD